jgi:hypothetical protein
MGNIPVAINITGAARYFETIAQYKPIAFTWPVFHKHHIRGNIFGGNIQKIISIIDCCDNCRIAKRVVTIDIDDRVKVIL